MDFVIWYIVSDFVAGLWEDKRSLCTEDEEAKILQESWS